MLPGRRSCSADAIAVELDFLNSLPSAERRRLRRQKFERMGAFVE